MQNINDNLYTFTIDIYSYNILMFENTNTRDFTFYSGQEFLFCQILIMIHIKKRIYNKKKKYFSAT